MDGSQVCARCGAPLAPGAAWCGRCGQAPGAAAVAPVVAPVQPQWGQQPVQPQWGQQPVQPQWAQTPPASSASMGQKVSGWWHGLSGRAKIGTGVALVVAILVLAAMGGASKTSSGANGSPSGTAGNLAAVTGTTSPTATTVAMPTLMPTILVPTPSPIPTATPAPTPTLAPMTYATLTSRAWALLVKAPDNYMGKGYKVWGCISQFDAATGPSGFLAQTSYRKESYWYLYGSNSMFTGDATQLANFVEGDLIYMNVVSLGSISYDTQIGGSTTVPAFMVIDITRKGACS